MPRNGKEGILFSFVMSALMIYIMAALNMYVRAALGMGGLTLTSPAEPWVYALLNFPLAFVVGIICDLGFCTPTSRKTMLAFCKDTDRAVWKGITVKFMMVVLMTVAMTIYGAIAAVGFNPMAVNAFFTLLPYNFIIAMPLQMLIIAPIAGKIVHAVGDKLNWNDKQSTRALPSEITTASDIMQKDVYTIPNTSSVGEALQEIIDKNVSGMPIVDNNQNVVGFISDSDILRAMSHSDLPVSDCSTLLTGLAKNELPKATSKEIMGKNVMEFASKEVISVKPKTPLEELSQLFGFRQLKKVPVIESGKLVGVVNRSRFSRRILETACLR